MYAIFPYFFFSDFFLTSGYVGLFLDKAYNIKFMICQ